MSFLLTIFFALFADKPTDGTPALSEAALSRRSTYGISLDALDYPVSSAYLDSLRSHGARVLHTSRWMNGATFSLDSAKIGDISALPFVTAVECTRDDTPPSNASRRKHLPSDNYTLPTWKLPQVTDQQLSLYNLLPLHDLGFKGQGITMAVCDGGFTNADTLSCFDPEHLLGWYDFTDDHELYDDTTAVTPAQSFFGEDGAHGTACLSAIAATKSNYTGAAPEVHYYLMRSEEMETESPKETYNLIAALECADSLGVDIFSVSLGYYYYDNSDWNLDPATLDGKTHRVSRAATIAARKGMLVVCSAGNEGNEPWRTIDLPADADSILTIGAVDTLGVIAAFSSVGPSADGRVKPELCAVGRRSALIRAATGEVYYGNGTSFSTPLLAGAAACLWSALRDENAMQIRERLIRSADRYLTPLVDYGYGIPDLLAAYNGTTSTDNPTLTLPTREGSSYKVLLNGRLLIIQNMKVYDVMGIPVM